jgi:alpha-L-fucosidase
LSSANLTSKWFEGSDLDQVIELFVSNEHAENYLNWQDTLSISVESDSLETTVPGTLLRLAPGQSAVVQVGVKNKPGITPGVTCDATVVATWGEAYGSPLNASQSISGRCGLGDYEASESSLSFHGNPDWFHEVKFGIFIHWGIYAVPAFGNEPGPKQDYAEWYVVWHCARVFADFGIRYGFRMTQPDFRSETYEYHRDTYGEDFNYDQFMSNFTDDAFDAKEWIDLIADAGAQYFVPVTSKAISNCVFCFGIGPVSNSAEQNIMTAGRCTTFPKQSASDPQSTMDLRETSSRICSMSPRRNTQSFVVVCAILVSGRVNLQ